MVCAGDTKATPFVSDKLHDYARDRDGTGEIVGVVVALKVAQLH